MSRNLFSVKSLVLAGALLASVTANAQIKILFDATKAEMAGNADWVIDYDQTNIKFSGSSGLPYLSTSGNQSNPQQIPTPPQSGITATTAETYWTGGISSWAVDCAKRGYIVETLPYNGSITYGDGTNSQDLSHYKIFVVDEPNIKFSAAEKTAILQFVHNGGRLFMIADHNVSDRNWDGWDSPKIWNDLLSNNTVQNYPFGIYFDTVDFSQTTTNVVAAATDSIIHGPMGNVTKVHFAGGTTMTLNPIQNATAKGVVYKTGTSAGNTNVMVAYARFGSGKVAALGDSSPTDDSTGNPTCTLYDGYWGDASGNHRLLLMNMMIWLADTTVAPTNVTEIVENGAVFTIAANPAKGNIRIVSTAKIESGELTVTNLSGTLVSRKHVEAIQKNEEMSVEAVPGFYIVRLETDKTIQTAKVVVY